MPTFNLLRETPDNSGSLQPTGETIEGSMHDAVERCVALAAKGGRYGMHVYEAPRHSDAMVADQAETRLGHRQSPPQSSLPSASAEFAHCSAIALGQPQINSREPSD